MDAATIVWTLILFGGTIVIVCWLLVWAWRSDKGKTHEEAEPEADS